jgi:TatD DNase family protein
LPHLCDTHCHLYLEEFAQDLNPVIERALESGITKILVPGIDIKTSQQTIALCGDYPGVLYAATGIHPNYAHQVGMAEVQDLEDLLKNNPGIRAIGEIGLDYYRTRALPEEQVFVFKEMLKLAADYNLPICIHVRQAEDDLLQILESWYTALQSSHRALAQNPGVFHSFDGSAKIADWALKHHFRLGISGRITYKSADDLRESLQQIGLENLITETDSPYLTPHPYRGKRNEPSYVNYIANVISQVLKIETDKIKEISSQNANLLFKWEHG